MHAQTHLDDDLLQHNKHERQGEQTREESNSNAELEDARERSTAEGRKLATRRHVLLPTASTPPSPTPAPATLPLRLQYTDPSTPAGGFGQQQAFFSQRPRSLSEGRAKAMGDARYRAVGFLPATLPSDLDNAWALTSAPQSISFPQRPAWVTLAPR
ncbi:hypothetical protein MSAN_01123800 [Mycena sanguinolenta]|uniref:Uncharacterized protein n=1 Tax=Mycena sanguinolenta TaxID=230812 RepID=A0A8H6YLQ6_9AGAR|nr:hypothetical protein MSAN_01123800 [Mycena sanguinolenta]